MDLLDRLDERLARQAFTHASLVADRGRSYERLEFLGDSVLSLCITGELYKRYPQHTEGHLARLRAYVVSRETCAKVAAELQLGRRLGRYAAAEHDRDEVDHLVKNKNVLADLTESVIGAVYLTFGFECVREAVVDAFDAQILYAERSHHDSKTELQEMLAKSGRTVRYVLVAQTGPAHERRFSVEAVVDDEVLGHGDGASKKRAEQMAAGEALAELTVRQKAGRPRRVRLLARRPQGAGEGEGADEGVEGASGEGARAEEPSGAPEAPAKPATRAAAATKRRPRTGAAKPAGGTKSPSSTAPPKSPPSTAPAEQASSEGCTEPAAGLAAESEPAARGAAIQPPVSSAPEAPATAGTDDASTASADAPAGEDPAATSRPVARRRRRRSPSSGA